MQCCKWIRSILNIPPPVTSDITGRYQHDGSFILVEHVISWRWTTAAVAELSISWSLYSFLYSAGFSHFPLPYFCPLQVFWALQLVTVLVPGAVFHLYAACKNIDQEEILERPIYTVFYIISVLLRIILEVIAFWLQSHLFGFQVCQLNIICNFMKECRTCACVHSSLFKLLITSNLSKRMSPISCH